MRNANGTTRQGQLEGLAPPEDADLELELLGAALHDWDRLEPRLGLEYLDPDLFHTEGHKLVALAINQAVDAGAVTPSIVSSFLDDEHRPLVDKAMTYAGFVPSALGRLAELAVKRRAFFDAARVLKDVGVPVAPASSSVPAPPVPSHNGHHPVAQPDFGGQVTAAYMNGGEAFWTVRYGADTHTGRDSEFRDGSAWAFLPEAPQVATRAQVAERYSQVRMLGAPILERAHSPAWIGDHLDAPAPEYAEAVGFEGLRGYGQLGPGADVATWAAMCDEVVKSPRLALLMGAPLAGLLLEEAGLEYDLDPLGFCVQAIDGPRRGKTSWQRAAAATLGNPGNDSKGGIVRSWGGSRLGMFPLAQALGVFPMFRSDTETWEHTTAELARAISGLVEGGRPVSTRDGRLQTRSGAYRSVLCSSGNNGICHAAAGPQIVARVVEVHGPFTLSRQHAQELKRLAWQGYGWPLARLRAGALPLERWRELVAQTVAWLVDEDDDGICQDRALRLAVLCAGAAALGELVSPEAMETMANAAGMGAIEALDDFRAEVDRQPVGMLLLEAAWEAFDRRPDAFPEPLAAEPPANLETWGHYRAEPERLSVFPGDLERIAKARGLDDYRPALRELAKAGLLVHSRGHMLDYLSRRNGHGGYRTVKAFTFLSPPEEEAPEGRARSEPPARAPRAPRARLESDGDQAARAARAVLDDKGPISKARAPRSAYFRAVSDGEALYTSSREEMGGGLAAVAARTAELSGDRRPLLWLTEQGRERFGLPPQARHAVEALRAQGIGAELRGDVLRLDSGVLVHAVEYIGDFGNLPAPGVWRALQLFSATVGLEYVFSPGKTASVMLEHARRRAPLDQGEPEPDLDPRLYRSAWTVRASKWERELTEPERRPGARLVAFDRRAAYLAAWRGCVLPDGPWGETGPCNLTRKSDSERRSGYYLLRTEPLAAELQLRGLPAVFRRHGPEQASSWVTAPLATLAADLADEFGLPPVECERAVLAAEHHTFLDSVAEVLTRAYVALKAEASPEAGAALDAIKGMYSERTMLFEREAKFGEGSDALQRRSWCYTVTDRHAANTFRALRSAGAVSWTNIDHATFVVDGDDDPPGLRLGAGPGCWQRAEL